MTGTATVLRADARALPLPDASVDLIVTSPPYFALRSYTDGGEHYGEQIRAEAEQLEERDGVSYLYAYGFAAAADFIDPTAEGKTDA